MVQKHEQWSFREKDFAILPLQWKDWVEKDLALKKKQNSNDQALGKSSVYSTLLYSLSSFPRVVKRQPPEVRQF